MHSEDTSTIQKVPEDAEMARSGGGEEEGEVYHLDVSSSTSPTTSPTTPAVLIVEEKNENGNGGSSDAINNNNTNTKKEEEEELQHSKTAVDDDGSSSAQHDEEEGSFYELLDELTTTEQQQQQQQLQNNRRRLYQKIAIGLFLLGFISFVIADSLTNQYIKNGIESFLEWMVDSPTPGFFAFVAVNFMTTLLFIPGILLTIGAGYVFSNSFGLGVGIVLGTVASFLAAFSGSVVSFVIGRFLLRDCVAGLTKKFQILEALDNAFEEKGFRIMALLRLSPLIYASPYLNYGSGGLAIKFWDFTFAMFAILPGTVMFVFLGASAESLVGGDDDEEDTLVTKIILILGIVLSVIAVGFTSYYAKIELDKVAAASAATAAAEIEASSSNNEHQQTNDNDDDDDAHEEKDKEESSSNVAQEQPLPQISSC